MTTKYQTREEWLNAGMQQLRALFTDKRFTVPKTIRVSCGLPSHGAFNHRKMVRGQVWSSKASKDKHHEIFISPTQEDPATVLAILTHEMIHATVGLEAGHRGLFIECARAVGFETPWTTATNTEGLSIHLKKIASRLGKYPHAELRGMTNGKKKQKSRLIKVGCPHCGYTTRIAMTWIIVAVPTCPNEDCEHHGEPFEVDQLEKPEDD